MTVNLLPPNKPSQTCQKALGQSLTEHALVIGLVSIASIGVLSGLDQNINLALQNMITHKTSSIGNTALVGNSGGGAGGGSIGQTTVSGSGSGATNGVTTGSTAGSTMANAFPTQRTCINTTLCIDLPNPTKDGQSVSDVAGNLGGNVITQYGNALDQVLDELVASEGLSQSDIADLVALAKQGHVLGDNLNYVDGQCQARTTKSQMCDVSNIQSRGNSMPPSPLMDRQTFEKLFAGIKSQFNDPNGLGSKVSPATQNLVMALSQNIIDVHKGAVPVTELTNPTTDPASQPTIDASGVETIGSSYFSVADINAAKIIHIDSNTICGTGTSNTGQCTVKNG